VEIGDCGSNFQCSTSRRAGTRPFGGLYQFCITRETFELIKDEFTYEPRGKVMVKGKGELETWYLVGQKSTGQASGASPP